VGNKDGVTSVGFIFTDIKIFSKFVVTLWGGRSSRMGCYYDHIDDNDNDAN
jgi:hypothetical protein